MTFRILTIVALIAATLPASLSALASDEALMTPNAPQADVDNPNTLIPPRLGGFACFARNGRGQTFRALGDSRTPIRFVQMRALRMCQRSLLPFGRCRLIGCRRLF